MNNLTIGIWGDSITQGYNDFEKHGWVNRMRLILKDDIGPFHLYNLGIGGNMSSDILKRLEGEGASRKIQTALIQVGVNDSAQSVQTGENRVSLEDYKKNLEEWSYSQKRTK